MSIVCVPDFAQSSESSSHPEEVRRDPALTPRLKLAEDSVLKANCENHSGSLFTSMVASQIKSLPFYANFFLIYKAVSFYALKANLDRRRGGWVLYYSLLSKDILSHYFMANGENVEVVTDFLFLISKITADGDGNHEIRFVSWEESCDKPTQCVEKQRHYSAEKCLYSQGYDLPSGHVWL